MILEDVISDLVEENHFTPGHYRFWCGFCALAVPNETPISRLNHIEDHYHNLGVDPSKFWLPLCTSEETNAKIQERIDDWPKWKQYPNFDDDGDDDYNYENHDNHDSDDSDDSYDSDDSVGMWSHVRID